MINTLCDGFVLGTYAPISVRVSAVRAALNMFAYEACPYNSEVASSAWVRILPGLKRAKKLELASAVAARVMQGRDRTYTRVVKLNNGTLALAE